MSHLQASPPVLSNLFIINTMGEEKESNSRVTY